MKRQVFQKGDTFIEYSRQRTGPPHQFVLCNLGKSWFCTGPKRVVKELKLSKGTPTREAVEEWLAGLNTGEAGELDIKRIKKEGFGPEAHNLDESDPNFQTRTVI